MRRAELHPAKQTRSSVTLDRILTATEKLLKDRDLGDVTMQDIARRARRSVGTVYARIPSKDVLIAHLFERFAERSEADVVELTTRGRREHWDLKRRVSELCRWIVDSYIAERGIVRSLAHCLFYQSPPVSDSFRRAITDQSARVVQFLAEDKASIAHRSAKGACEFALTAALAVAQNRIVFGSTSSVQFQFPAKKLVRELTRMTYSYLTAKSSSGS